MSKPSRPKAIKLQKEEEKRISKSIKSDVDPKNIILIKRDKLMKMLNKKDTNCHFWWGVKFESEIMGIRPVSRNTIEVINPNGFSPYRKEQEEKLFKVFIIDIVDSDKQYIYKKEDKNKEIRLLKDGYIYLKSGNIDYIYDFIRKNT